MIINTNSRILVDNKYVLSFGKFHYEASKIASTHLNMVDICSDFTKLSAHYLQVSLNCFIMFATF